MPKLNKTRCPQCRATVPHDATLCPFCGTHLAEAQQSTQCPDCGARYNAEQHACPICGACFEQPRGFAWGRLGVVLAGLSVLAVLAGTIWRDKSWERTAIALAPTGTPTLTPYPTWTPSPMRAATATPTVSPTALDTPTPAVSPTSEPIATEAAMPTEEPTAEPTATEVATPTQSVDRYAVEAGDNLGSIARRFGMTLEALLTANALTERSILQVGQELVITGANLPAPSATPMPSVTATASATAELATGGGPTLAAETLATPSPQTLATPAPLVHVVGPGDMLGSLAVKYDVAAEEIATVNNITLRTILRVGQELTIPGKQTTSTATAMPSPSVTSTATATATPTPTPFRTRAAKPGVPAFPYRQVIALAPVDGAVIYGVETGIVLNWTSVGILSEQEWYQVSLWIPGDSDPLVSYTKATSWRLSPEMYRGESQVRDYFWQVRVAYRPNAEGTDVALSPPSERLGFQWR